MSVETLEKKFYTTYSDIWSLGVLLWELSTLAAMPYEVSERFQWLKRLFNFVISQEVDVWELAPYLRDGFRLAQPVNCPDEL